MFFVTTRWPDFVHHCIFIDGTSSSSGLAPTFNSVAFCFLRFFSWAGVQLSGKSACLAMCSKVSRSVSSIANLLRMLRHLHKCCTRMGESSSFLSAVQFLSSVSFPDLGTWPCRPVYLKLLGYSSDRLGRLEDKGCFCSQLFLSSEAFSVSIADVLVWIQTSSQGQHPAIYLQPTDTMVLEPP